MPTVVIEFKRCDGATPRILSTSTNAFRGGQDETRVWVRWRWKPSYQRPDDMRITAPSGGKNSLSDCRIYY
jgi:hypothetical protein